MDAMFKSLWSDQRIRFALLGSVNTFVGWILFVVAQYLFGERITYFGSLFISFFLGTFFSFTLQKFFVFRVSGNIFLDFVRFTSVYIPIFLLNIFVLPIFVTILGANIYIVQTVFTLFVAVVSYLAHKHYSFRRK